MTNTALKADASITQAWQQGRTRAFAAFEQDRKPFICLRALSDIADETVRALWQECASDLPPYTLIATGGYGRRELYPQSDIDILLLHDGDANPFEAAIGELLDGLYALGLKVGYACRSIQECLPLAQRDHTIFTTLLDARILLGEGTLFARLRQKLLDIRQSGGRDSFIQAKLNERQERLEKYGRSRFLLEPNIKENAGGLRDLHTLYWLARYVYGVRRVSELVKLDVLSASEYRQFYRAHHFHATVRIMLHQLSGRGDERLTFDRQQQIAEWLGFRANNANKPVERFMKRYFQTARNVSQLTRLFCAIIEEDLHPHPSHFFARLFERYRATDRFSVRGHWLDFKPDIALDEQPIFMLKLFAMAQEEGLDIHAHAMRLVARHVRFINAAMRRDERANALFMQMLLSPHRPDLTLTRLNDAGLLSKFIPDFAYIVGQIQFDRYHTYTVDEHSIRLIGQLHQIETGALSDELPLASEMIHQIDSRRALFLATFCHDIAKGRGGNHEQKGVEIMHKLGKRFGLEPSELALAKWLVEHQSLFSHTAFSRDLDDPQTIFDFVEKVQSPERLKCLLLLTVADIRSVGPTIWNGWKGALLRDLFARAENEMLGREHFDPAVRIMHLQGQLSARLDGWSPENLSRLIEQTPDAFWLGLPEEHLYRTALLLRRIWEGEVSIALDHQSHPFEAITHLQLCLPNHHALLHLLAGCITRIGGSILSIKSVTLHDGCAVILVDLQDKNGGAYEQIDRLNALPELLIESISHPATLAQHVDKRRPKPTARSRALAFAPAIYVNSKLSRSHTVIEVDATDRIGLLYDITGGLSKLNLHILSSHITTYGEKAVDVFYVQDGFGQKIRDEHKIATIRRELLATLAYQEWKG